MCVALVGYFLHRDYAWQIILLLGVVPPSREHCTLPSSLPRRAGRASADSGRSDTRLSNPTRFGILMLFDEAMLLQEMTQLSVENKRNYAARHGYDLIVSHGDDVDGRRPPAWSKFVAMQRHLPRFDYLLFMDVDTLVMNDEVRLEDLVSRGEGRGNDLVISEDWNGVNTGVFMLRNSSWSRWFLKEAWGQKVKLPGAAYAARGSASLAAGF